MDSYYTLSQKDQGKPSNSYRLSNLDRYTRKLRFRVSLLFRKKVYIQFYSNQQRADKQRNGMRKKHMSGKIILVFQFLKLYNFRVKNVVIDIVFIWNSFGS